MIDSLNLLAFELRNSFPDSSVSLAVKALGLAETRNYLRGQAIALNIQGIYHKNKGRRKSLKNFMTKVENQAKDCMNLLAEQYLNLGNFFKQGGELDSALLFLKQAYFIQDSLGYFIKCQCTCRYWTCVESARDYAESLKYFDNGLRLQRSSGNDGDVARALIRKGEVFELLKLDAEAPNVMSRRLPS